MSNTRDLSVFAGEKFDIRVNVTDDEGEPLNLSDFDVEYKDTREVFKEEGDGIDVPDPAEGVFFIELDEEDNADAGSFYYEIRVFGPSIRTILTGELEVKVSLYE